MAKLNTAIDVAEIDRSADQSFDLLPNGDFLMEIIAIDQKRDGTNVAHSYTYSVIEPEEFKGRRMWDWLDLEHETEWMQQKGQARLGNLCDSIGYDPVAEGILEDDDNLMFRAFMARVGRQEAGVSKKTGKEFKAKNVVTRFYKPDDKDAPAAAGVYAEQPKPAANDNRPAARPAQQAVAPAAGKRPWSQRAA